MNRIKLKNIKFSEDFSEETHCFRADIYFDNKLVGQCENEGRGGSTYCYHYDIEYKQKFAEAEEYCKSLPPIKYDTKYGNEGFELDCNLEHVVDLLFDDWLKAKDDKKMKKNFEKGICFGDDFGYQVTTFKLGGKGITINEIIKTQQGIDHLKKTCAEKISQGYKILNTNLPFEI